MHTTFLGSAWKVSSLGVSAMTTLNSPNDGYCAFAFTTPTGTCGLLTYNGGSVENQGQVQIILDYWAGPGWAGCNTGLFDSPTLDPTAVTPSDCQFMSLVDQYVVDMCADTVYTNLLQQYLFESIFEALCTKYVPTISGVTNSFIDIRAFPELPLSDGDIQNEANAADTFEGFSSNGYNTLVVVLLPFNVGECQSGSNCFPTGNFCAYHQSTGSSLGSEIQYAVMPDVADAGSGCINASSSPHSDQWADAEINILSHEQQESMTDPDGSAWNCSSSCTGAGSGAEIGDECNFDFIGTEPDGSTTLLAPLGAYRLQAEWSNFNGGCTRDEAGAPIQVTESIKQDTSTGTTASPENFVINYQEAGQFTPDVSLTKTCCVGSIVFFVTPSSSVETLPDPGSEAWCFDTLCATQVASITAPKTLSYFYYQMYVEHPYEKVIDGGVPPYTPTFTYTTAPSCTTLCTGVPDAVVKNSVKLTTTPGSVAVFVSTGTKATVDSCIPVSRSGSVQHCGTNMQRWDTGGPCQTAQPFTCTTSLTASAPNSIANVNYWHQWLFTGSYSVLDGGLLCGAPPCYHKPSVSGTRFGKNFVGALSTSPTSYWLDATTAWSVTNPLTGSTSANRWDTAAATAGTMNFPVTATLVYYHQAVLTLSYSIVGGGLPSGPTLTGTAWGKSGTIAGLTTTPLGFFLDYGTPWSVTNPLTPSTGSERWWTPAATSGFVTTQTISFSYQHQFFVTFVASPVFDGSVTPSSQWILAGSSLNITATPFAGFSFSSWTSSTSSITITAPNSATTTATINGAGTVTAKFT